MGNNKINLIKLNQMLRAGKPVKDCASFFKVSPSAISQAKKSLNISVVKNVALESAHRVVDKNLNTVEQLHKINKAANNLLDTIEKRPELKIKVMAEIRNQLRLQLEIFQTLYDLQAVQEFQQEVLEVIGTVSPEVKDAIINRLVEKHALRRSININP